MGLQYRTIRAAASVLLVAAAVGTGGMTGIGSVRAADPPATVFVTGTLANEHGTGLPFVHLVVAEMLPPDGGAAGFDVTTGPDGGFGFRAFAWGTTDAPAQITITTPPDTETGLAVNDDCHQTVGVAVHDTRDVALADVGAEVPVLDLVAATTVLGEVCATTATPKPDGPRATNRPGLTPPPTDTFGRPIAGDPDRTGPALTIGFLVGLVAAAVLLLPRPGARRRD